MRKRDTKSKYNQILQMKQRRLGRLCQNNIRLSFNITGDCKSCSKNINEDIFQHYPSYDVVKNQERSKGMDCSERREYGFDKMVWFNIIYFLMALKEVILIHGVYAGSPSNLSNPIPTNCPCHCFSTSTFPDSATHRHTKNNLQRPISLPSYICCDVGGNQSMQGNPWWSQEESANSIQRRPKVSVEPGSLEP